MNPTIGAFGRDGDPREFGRYKIIGVHRKPAIGVVYKAFDPDARQVVAIKAVHKELLEDPESDDKYPARIWNEIDAVGKLRHPGIVALYDTGQTPDFTYFVMEFIDHPPLAELLDAGTRFEIAASVRFIASLLDALEHAHQRGIWHGDLSPRSIAMTDSGEAKITDFFLACVNSSSLTSVGDVLGSRGYVAPESYRGGVLDHRTDLFGAAVLLYRMLSGVAPFAGSAPEVFKQVLEMNVLAPSRQRKCQHLAPFDAVVLKAMAANAVDRFESAAALRNALLEICPQADLHATPAGQLLPAAQIAARAARKRAPSSAVTPAQAPAAAARLLDDDDFDAELITLPRIQVAPRPTMPSPAARQPASCVQAPTVPLATPPAPDAQFVALAQARLTAQLGPIAAIVIRRVAADARTPGEFLTRVLAQIPDEAGRRKFAQEMAPGR